MLRLRSIVFALFFVVHPLHAAVVTVAPPPASIQAAINAAAAGDTVQLSAGTYVEAIVVTKSLTLAGAGIDVSVIQCPTAPAPLVNSFVFTPSGATYHPFVMVEGATDLVIENLTIDGGSQSSNFLSYRFEGIAYHNAGGTVQNVHAKNVQDSSPGGPTQHGFAIAAAADDGNPHAFAVTGSTVDNFQKAGIDIRGATLTANIANNTVTGETPASTANANGIVVQFGAQATITGNTVTNLKSTVAGSDAVGILLNGAGANSTVSNNTANGSDIGIYSSGAGDGLAISGNSVADNGDVGIYVQDTNGTSTLQHNTLTDNANDNMVLVDSTGNRPFQLGQNAFVGSQTGLSVQGNATTGPVVTMNADSFTGTTGDYIEEVDSPNDIWPSTSGVTFDGLSSGHVTMAEYNQILAKIVDKHGDAALGLVLDFIVPGAPVLSAISPASGPVGGGTTVTITGTGFLSSNTTVAFGGTPAANVVVVSDTQITATAPAGSGTVDVTVATPFGTTPVVAAGAYAYFAAPTVSIAFAPASIATGATSTLTITLANGAPTAATLTAALTDVLPANLAIAAVPNASTTCGAGALTAAAGTVSLLPGATIGASGSCVVQVNVTSAIAGNYTNSLAVGALQTDLGSNAAAADGTLVVTVAVAPAPAVPAPIDAFRMLLLLSGALVAATAIRDRRRRPN